MQSKQLSWRFAWDYPAFRVKLLLGIFVMGMIVFYLQDFFLLIQPRSGVLLNDWVLNELPARDVSSYIFLILYPASGFFFWRMRKNSTNCITALWGYVFLCSVRMITIAMVPLDAPKHLIHLSDPFSIIFYGANPITKDLFFSGHTATLFLVGLCLEDKREKAIIFAATAVLAVLLLIQHVHYTVDVLAAPFFSYLFWYMGKTVAKM
ncbi:phosphatase PAP2-related protein [Pedobacter sp. L105]|uniref:phosphatase PAP2-related protein n=1 Tax=Pedobacter sp. L105 TaxID=1641871 RepID=UPI00131C34C2|nr:phosphatase PAP2-related protein [Pedobacter sp. L105]